MTARSPADRPGETQERGYEAALDAVLDFADHLQGRDIDLVIMPILPKLAVHADQFNSAYQGGLIETADYQNWLRRVQAAGVKVFEVGDAIESFHAQSDLPAYLKTDTHWRPEAMEWCAGALVDFLASANLISVPTQPIRNVIDETSIRARGDLWRMLRLSESSSQFMPESVTLRQIRTANGMRWQADRSSDVLLLGDSFSNIYSLAQMGWGEGAGFAEHLSHQLGRPLDAILRNSDGAHATRQILSRELARGFDRLEGKSLVIWEFAARELTHGRWPKFSYQLGEKAAGNFIEVDAREQHEFEATLVDVSPIPVPGSVPYQDFLATLHFRDVGKASEKSKGGSEMLVYAAAMTANRWTDVATLRPGQKLRMKVGNWLDAEARYGRWNRSELSEDLLLEPVNWMIEMTLVEDGDE
ncbi:MAG: alginate O-acetyltransferase AlgX-related protein [Luteolibacter sp.]